MAAKSLLTKEILPSGKHTATVIFFHGSGDSGENLLQWIRFLICRDFQSSYIKFIFPTAPIQPYTKLNGRPSKIWFDRQAIEIESIEDRKSLSNIFPYVADLIKKEVELGIPLQRIVVGGYSMGGTLAIYTGYHLFQNVAAVFACSSFLNKDAMLFEELKSCRKFQLPKLLYFHGTADELVRYEWGRKTFERLKELGVTGEFRSIENMYHEIQKQQCLYLEKWFHDVLPSLDVHLKNKL
ncbi:lysophospholipase-like protein 1 [Bradysia coprophila]|uniref:lysophospholipase-like protein 1 n=1 Tax=Bradysia coprophila TaxID=38358 RepID=UPI00187DD50D|nr:lysophospholipase-like protein 1 [Bradysia coprophila]